MMTGDAKGTAMAVGLRLGIDEVEAEVTPERKQEVVAALKVQGRSSPWREMASTTRRPSPRPMSASPWATAPTSRWRAPLSPCSKAT